MNKKLLLTLMSTFALLTTACGITPSGNGGTSQNSVPESLPLCPEDDEKVHLYILAGQSGARGKALNEDLTDEQKETNLDVDIIADGLMMNGLSNIPTSPRENAVIAPLEKGYGDAAGEFGPELGMGQTLASRFPRYSDASRTVIIKYTACGSTFTADWYSSSTVEDATLSAKLNKAQIRTNEVTSKQTGPLTNNLYQLIDKAVESLEGEGLETVIEGAAFIHGEQDAKFDENMSIYEGALTNFIKDLRSYVGNDNLPVVITEALTNSAKYSNELRAIQKRVAAQNENNIFISADGLYTNTFEPWHFGAQSNIVLGNRIAAELIAKNDNRVVSEVLDAYVDVPVNVDVALPEYLTATFDNDLTGLMKVKYTSNYNKATLGEQEVDYVVDSGCGTPYKGKLTVNVTNEPRVDGVLSENEYANAKKNSFADNVGDVYVVKGAEGLYISGRINDDDLWTDGELWGNGDMGQKGENDDMRIFLTGSDLDSRVTIALSAANLLRVYDNGVGLSDTGLHNSNCIYKKYYQEYAYRATTEGLANVPVGSSTGFAYEIYISYVDLGLDDAEGLKMCFAFNDVSKADADASKTNVSKYLTAAATTDGAEDDLANYIDIANLI